MRSPFIGSPTPTWSRCAESTTYSLLRAGSLPGRTATTFCEPINGDRIYNGAMDDASGVASLLDIAAELHAANTQTKRSLLFIAVTGEEKGLLGSRYFAAHPTVVGKQLAEGKQLVADLNMDMFLPLHPLHLLTVWGLNESDLGDLARSVSKS